MWTQIKLIGVESAHLIPRKFNFKSRCAKINGQLMHLRATKVRHTTTLISVSMKSNGKWKIPGRDVA